MGDSGRGWERTCRPLAGGGKFCGRNIRWKTSHCLSPFPLYRRRRRDGDAGLMHKGIEDTVGATHGNGNKEVLARHA